MVQLSCCSAINSTTAVLVPEEWFELWEWWACCVCAWFDGGTAVLLSCFRCLVWVAGKGRKAVAASATDYGRPLVSVFTSPL